MTPFVRSLVSFVVIVSAACSGVDDPSLSSQKTLDDKAPTTTHSNESAPAATEIPGAYSLSHGGEITASERLTLTQELLPTGGQSSDVLPLTFEHRGPAFPSDCVELNTAYSYPAYMVRMRVTGRPGAVVYKFNLHESCAPRGAVPQFAGMFTIPSGGVLEVDYFADFIHSCDASYLGRWVSWVVSDDGVMSAKSPITYYQSACPGPFSRCDWARVSCPSTGP